MDNNLKILPVDEFEIMRMILRMALSEFGLNNIKEAVNGRVSLARIKEADAQGTSFVNTFCDWSMSEAPGIEVIETLRAQKAFKNLPFIMVVADAEQTCDVQGDVLGILKFSQEKYEGAPIITFPKKTTFKVLDELYRQPISQIDKSLKSGFGKLTSISYAGMKKNLNNYRFNFKYAVPHVVVGEYHSVMVSSVGPSMISPFETDIGAFNVIIYFDDEEKSQAA